MLVKRREQWETCTSPSSFSSVNSLSLNKLKQTIFCHQHVGSGLTEGWTAWRNERNVNDGGVSYSSDDRGVWEQPQEGATCPHLNAQPQTKDEEEVVCRSHPCRSLSKVDQMLDCLPSPRRTIASAPHGTVWQLTCRDWRTCSDYVIHQDYMFILHLPVWLWFILTETKDSLKFP